MPRTKRSESGSKGAILAAIVAAVGGWGTAAITNWDKLTGAPPTTSAGSPFVKWDISSSNAGWQECSAKALETLQRSEPAEKISTYSEKKAGVQIGESRVVGFPSTTGWISCVRQDALTLVFIGTAGSVESEAQSKLEQLTALLGSQLPLNK